MAGFGGATYPGYENFYQAIFFIACWVLSPPGERQSDFRLLEAFYDHNYL